MPEPAAPGDPLPDTSGAQLLLLLGAAITAAMPLLLAGLFLWTGAVADPEIARFTWVMGLGGIAFAAGGFGARAMVQRGQRRRGGLFAVVLGCAAAVTGNVLGGLLLAVGGVLAHRARAVAPGPVQGAIG